MSHIIQNGINHLEDLFAINCFRIPQYQRAYSWIEDPHLEAFLEDLRQQVKTQKKNPAKSYFLGTLLLHAEELGRGRQVINIVDGQQRMTTSVVFIATALAQHDSAKISISNEKPALLKRNFIYDDATDSQKFHTISEDGPFFRSMILRVAEGPCAEDSPSSRRLQNAKSFFENNVNHDEWEDLIQVLKTAKVMVYSVASAADATQIFELQNDRGKRLTNLEALKSYLMHCIYLHSPTQSADDQLAALQTQFSNIYRSVERIAEWGQAPDENQLLSNHCAAYLGWTSAEYNDPKHLVKATIKKMHGQKVVPWIENFVGSLVQSFNTIEALFNSRDSLSEFSDLLLLGRMGSFWPLILKTWRSDLSTDKKNFLKGCRLLEVFTFRGYAIAGLRSDTALSTFLTTARDFSGDFYKLLKQLAEISVEYDLEKRYLAGLDSTYFYNAEGRDALYLLWRYENYLRTQAGTKNSLLSWRDFDMPRSHGAKLSVEHVAAVSNELSDIMVEWEERDPKPFHEVALNRLGNLVVDSISSNSSKGKRDFFLKHRSYSEKSIYLSQGELTNFLTNSDVLDWDVNAIRKRHAHLTDFARKTWHPDTYFTPS
jgi:Protein of unknown function DUF262/Protein of unknown function (DUF1524)